MLGRADCDEPSFNLLAQSCSELARASKYGLSGKARDRTWDALKAHFRDKVATAARNHFLHAGFGCSVASSELAQS